MVVTYFSVKKYKRFYFKRSLDFRLLQKRRLSLETFSSDKLCFVGFWEMTQEVVEEN